MSMTVDELAFVRSQTGDVDSNDYYNTDNELNYLFNNKADSNVEYTIVWALRAMVAKAFRKVARSSNITESVQNQQEWEHLQAHLKYWQAQAMYYPTISAGNLDLGIDADEDLL
jgi:hypothetical protein